MAGPKVTPENEARFRVYFASALDKVKIGCSTRPVARILKVGEWIPFPITMLATMPGAFALEATIHRMFSEEWSHGEWFYASPRLLDFIARVANGLPTLIEDRVLAEADDLRRQAIAHKKRIGRKKRILPADLMAEISAVQPGMPIPDDVLMRTYQFLDARSEVNA